MIENKLKRDKIQAISTKGNRMHWSLPNRLDIYVGNQPIFYLSDILVKQSFLSFLLEFDMNHV